MLKEQDKLGFAGEVDMSVNVLSRVVPKSRVPDASLSRKFLDASGLDPAGHQAEHEETVHNYNVQGLDGGTGGAAEKTGAMSTSIDNTGSATDGADSKKKNKKDDVYRLLRILEQIEWLNERIAEIKEALNAVSQAKELYLSGELNFNNPDHAAILEEAGVSKEDIKQKGEQAFDDREEVIKDKLKIFRQERKQAQKELEEFKSDPAIQKEFKERANTKKGKQDNDTVLFKANIKEQREIIDTYNFLEEIKQGIEKKSLEDSQVVNHNEFDFKSMIARTSVAKSVMDDYNDLSCKDEFNRCVIPDVSIKTAKMESLPDSSSTFDTFKI